MGPFCGSITAQIFLKMHGLAYKKFSGRSPNVEIVSEMTYNVSMGTLNPTIPYPQCWAQTGAHDHLVSMRDVNALLWKQS